MTPHTRDHLTSTPHHAEVFLCPGSGTRADPAERHTPRVLWFAPGSLHASAADIERGWHRDPDPTLHRLRAITGPWAAALSTATDVLLVCDPIGVQPLFWARTRDGGIAAASWLAQLVDRPDVDDTVDPEGLLLDQGCGLQDPRMHHRTAFRAVWRVPGGHVLRIRRDGSTALERYWDPARLPGPDESLTLADCADLVRERIDVALRRVLDDDEAAPFGAHVSGGLDSSALACRAQALLRERGSGLVAGMTWSPDERHATRVPGDERQLVDAVAAHCGLPVHAIDPAADDDAWFWSLDPARYPDSTHFREAAGLSAARRLGIRTVLSGWGGDELASFNGRGVLEHLVRRGRVPTVWRESTQRLETLADGPAPGRQRARAVAGIAWRTLPPPVRALRHPRRARAERRADSELAVALSGLSPLAAEVWRDQSQLPAAPRSPHERQLELLAEGYLQHRTTAWYQSGRLMDVQYRFPLLDLDVVAAALRMPWWAYRSHGWDRTAFRLAVAPWVPEAVAWNVTKDEPALFGTTMLTADDWLPRRRGGTDERTQRAWALIDRTWEATASPGYVPAQVRARPDRAPRLG